jgi:hypothetical protein
MTTDKIMNDAEFEAWYGKTKAEWKREAALKQVQFFSRRAGLVDPDLIPKVILDESELDEAARKKLEEEPCYGAYIPHTRSMYLNLEMMGTQPGSQGFIADLADTIAHELVHARFPMIPHHGKEFQRRKAQILDFLGDRCSPQIRPVHYLPTANEVSERKAKRRFNNWYNRRAWREMRQWQKEALS